MANSTDWDENYSGDELAGILMEKKRETNKAELKKMIDEGFKDYKQDQFKSKELQPAVEIKRRTKKIVPLVKRKSLDRHNKKKRYRDCDHSDEDDTAEKARKVAYVPFNKSQWKIRAPSEVKRKKSNTVHVVKTPAANITEKELNQVAMNVSEKKNKNQTPTTCHQCRQKTPDQKSICRNAECIGVQGQFCGPCLSNRYDEKVKDVLKDENWQCPPCRQECNCSICRTRDGLRPTGILAGVAKASGYASAKHYLNNIEIGFSDATSET